MDFSTHATHHTNNTLNERDNPEDLFGRQEVLQQLFDARSTHQIIQVTGPPGVGKSSILSHINHTWASTYLVDLTEHQTSNDCLMAIAKHLQLPFRSEEKDWEGAAIRQINDALFHKPGAHVLLDNVEHLHGIIEPLVTQLGENNDAHFVLGSRIQLNIQAYHLALAPWSIEDSSTTGWHQHPGVQLFLHTCLKRGRQWHEDEHIKDIANIVKHVEGLPLAIELVASRATMQSPRALFQRMQAQVMPSFGLQQKLHNTIEWSWNLLDESAQDVLAQISLFRGGFTLSMLESIYKHNKVDLFEVIEDLQKHGLLHSTQSKKGIRCNILLYIREFAQTFVTQVHKDRFIATMADFSFEHFELAKGYIWSKSATPFFEEHDNVHQAYALSKQQEETTENDLKLATGMYFLSRRFCDVPTTYRVHKDVQDFDMSHLPERTTWYLQMARLDTISMLEEMDDAISGLTALLEKIKSDDVLTCLVCVRLVSTLDIKGLDYTSVLLAYYEQGMALAHQLGDLHSKVRLLTAMSLNHTRQMNITGAIATSKEAIDLAQKLGAKRDEARALANLSYAFQSLGAFERAYEPMLQSVDYFEESQDIIGCMHVLRMFAWMATDTKRLREARVTIDKLMVLASQYGLNWMHGTSFFLRGQLNIEEAQCVEATIDLERAYTYFKRDDMAAMACAAKLFQSLAFELSNDMKEARESFEIAMTFADQLHSPHAKIHLNVSQVNWLLHDGKIAKAKALWEETLGMNKHKSPLWKAMTDLQECAIALYLLKEAQQKNKPRNIKKHQTTLLTRLSDLTRSPDQDPSKSIINRDVGLRIGSAILRKNMPQHLLKRLDIEIQDPMAKALLVDLAGQVYRAPDQTQWTDMTNRHTPFKLLETLVLERLNRPGNALDMDTLCERVWQDEIIAPEAANNRLYVTISTLRREGLKQVIINSAEGYLIDPNTPILEVT